MNAMEKQVRARRADNRDAEVGRRMRSRRLECRLSQSELADKIGVTFQQVQKYEKGVNRVGAGRLQRISEALEVPISFFFNETKPKSVSAEGMKAGAGESLFSLVQTSNELRMAKAFRAIKGRNVRVLFVGLLEEVARLQAAA
jgi:transcriptional regulator with XRE-family HTH domain